LLTRFTRPYSALCRELAYLRGSWTASIRSGS
jgi:hypothetical protein